VIADVPPAPIVAAVKAVYPRSPIRVERICTVNRRALVRVRVRGRELYIALERPARRWRVVWVDGSVVRRIPPARRAAVDAEVARLRTRCLAP
jgi:hypothetical protein